MAARLPITAVAVFGVGGLIASAVGLALYLGVASASRNTRGLLEQQAGTLIASMEGSLDARLSPVAEQGEWIRRQVKTGALDPRDPRALDLFMLGALSATPQVAGIAVVDPRGWSRRWGRDDPVPIEEDWSERAPIRSWLVNGRTRDAGSWQPPFWTPTLDITVLLYDAPLTNGGRFLGMLGQVVPVTGVSSELVRDYAELGLIPFVLLGRERVLAHPLLVYSAGDRAEDSSTLLTLEELGDPVLAAIWSRDNEASDTMPELVDVRSSIVRHQGAEYLFLHKTIDRYGPMPWTFGAYVDTRLHGGRELDRIALAAGGGIAVLVGAVVLATVVGMRLSRRIGDLSAAARAVEGGTLDQVPRLRPSGIREIDDATRSFHAMIEGLRERTLVRATLGRFVPEPVARSLLDEGGRLAPSETEATLLFCDIEDFTRLTEAHGAQGIIEILNAFFSDMVRILERHRGVVTQFQGDAILATFNVPLANEHHAADALRAALEMQRRTEEGDFAGQRLRVRIGVNTGSVVAGAVGAEGRLSYTVHGDAVNLAARLEALNKAFGTRVLASEHTVSRTSGFELREVDEACVRGQSTHVSVYEVVGPASAA